MVNLDKLQEFIHMGRLAPKPSSLVTMRDLLESGLISSVKDGVKLLSRGKKIFSVPIHLEVSSASNAAIAAVEKAGGTVTCSHFTDLTLRALLKPHKFDILPRRPRPSPKLMDFYLDRSKSGYLSPEVQIRNLKMFGNVTSEEIYRTEHENLMNSKRKLKREQFEKEEVSE